MPNTIQTVKQAQSVIAKSAAAMFKNKMQFLRTIDIEPDSTFGEVNGYKTGDTVSINKPARFTMNNTADITSAIQDVVEERVPLVLNRQRNVPIALTSAEIATDLGMKQWMKRILEPAVTTLVNGIEAECLADAKNATWNAVGTPGNTVFDTDLSLSAREKIVSMASPIDDNFHFLLNPSAMRSAVNSRKGLFNKSDEISKQYKRGYMGESDGFKYHESNLIATHTNGTDVTGIQVNATLSTEGVSQIVFKGVDNPSGTFTKGQSFTIDGVYAVNPVTYEKLDYLQQFVVTEDVAGAASTTRTVNFAPAIYTTGSLKNVDSFPQEDANIVFQGAASTAYAQNLAYHKSAFRFVSAPLVLPNGAHMASQKREDGISIRVIQDHDVLTDKMIMRLDVLYGFVAVRPEWAVRAFK